MGNRVAFDRLIVMMTILQDNSNVVLNTKNSLPWLIAKWRDSYQENHKIAMPCSVLLKWFWSPHSLMVAVIIHLIVTLQMRYDKPINVIAVKWFRCSLHLLYMKICCDLSSLCSFISVCVFWCHRTMSPNMSLVLHQCPTPNVTRWRLKVVRWAFMYTMNMASGYLVPNNYSFINRVITKSVKVTKLPMKGKRHCVTWQHRCAWIVVRLLLTFLLVTKPMLILDKTELAYTIWGIP